jgi:hypothetical protein
LACQTGSSAQLGGLGQGRDCPALPVPSIRPRSVRAASRVRWRGSSGCHLLQPPGWGLEAIVTQIQWLLNTSDGVSDGRSQSTGRMGLTWAAPRMLVRKSQPCIPCQHSSARASARRSSRFAVPLDCREKPEAVRFEDSAEVCAWVCGCAGMRGTSTGLWG